MKNWIAVPRSEGLASRQAHCDLPPGTFEREIGKEGFFGPATHMYHANPPTGWVGWEGPLKPRAFDLVKLSDISNSPLDVPVLMHNAATQIRLWRMTGAMDHLVRNGDGDELIFIHAGAGDIFTDYGRLSFREGDYILLPRSTTWRIEASSPVAALLIEATNDHYMLPHRGLVGPHAIFDPAILDTPKLDDAFKAQQGAGEWRIRIKRRNQISTVTYPYNPLDAVGWKGDLMCQAQLARHSPLDEPSLSFAALGPLHLSGRALRGLHFRAPAD